MEPTYKDVVEQTLRVQQAFCAGLFVGASFGPSGSPALNKLFDDMRCAASVALHYVQNHLVDGTES